MKPLVSTVIAAWNAENVLEKSIKSALAQDIDAVEVIVIDDASSDKTYAKAVSFSESDRRIVPLQLKQNSGPAAARNLGLAVAKGKFVAVLDADDTWAPNRLQNLLDVAHARSADVVFDNIMEVNKDDIAFSDTAFLSNPEFATSRNISLNDYIDGNFGRHGEKSLGYLKPLIATDFLKENNIKYDESLRNGEDFHFILSCFAARANVWFTPEPNYRYTRGEASISHRSDPDHLMALIKADERFLERCSDADTKALMRGRLEMIKHSFVTETVMNNLKAGHLIKAIMTLAKSPKALPKLSQHLGEALGKRIQRLIS